MTQVISFTCIQSRLTVHISCVDSIYCTFGVCIYRVLGMLPYIRTVSVSVF